MDLRYLLLQRLSNGIELLSALVLIVGFAKGMWGFLLYEWQEWRRTVLPDPELKTLAALRPLVGNYILLGLDFYIVSDILASMLHPDWQELISLAIIVGLRTAIGFFLGKELEQRH